MPYVSSFLRKMGIDLDGGLPNFFNGFKVGGVAVTPSAAELNKVDGYTGTTADLNLLSGVAADSAIINKVAVVTLGAADTPGGVLAWQNPTGGKIVVTGVILDITTKSTGASTIDVGYAANGTTSADSLMDGLDTGGGVGTYNNIDNKGTNGLGSHSTTMTSSQFITASKATGACAGLAGKAYIYYNEA
jgi:hypothetical protein